MLNPDVRRVLDGTSLGHPCRPVIIRGRVTEWLEGDTAWEIIDQIATKGYRTQPRPRHILPARHRLTPIRATAA